VIDDQNAYAAWKAKFDHLKDVKAAQEKQQKLETERQRKLAQMQAKEHAAVKAVREKFERQRLEVAQSTVQSPPQASEPKDAATPPTFTSMQANTGAQSPLTSSTQVRDIQATRNQVKDMKHKWRTRLKNEVHNAAKECNLVTREEYDALKSENANLTKQMQQMLDQMRQMQQKHNQLRSAVEQEASESTRVANKQRDVIFWHHKMLKKMDPDLLPALRPTELVSAQPVALQSNPPAAGTPAGRGVVSSGTLFDGSSQVIQPQVAPEHGTREYVMNVNPFVDPLELEKAVGEVAEFTNFEVVAEKGYAFFDFGSPAAFQAAVSAGPYKVSGVHLYVVQR
jgi:hypothetical protein